MRTSPAASIARSPPSDPAALADAVILVPTRRAARSLAHAFLASAGGQGPAAAADPGARRPGRRRGAVRAGGPRPRPAAGDQPLAAALRVGAAGGGKQNICWAAGSTRPAALELADALAGFLDACQIEETGDPRAVEALVEGDLARHWQASARFLNLALEVWPGRLAALGLVDVATRRVLLLRRLAEAGATRPPDGVIVAAGSTGSAPAAADLLAAIAAAPRGAWCCPGSTSRSPTTPGPRSTTSIRRAGSNACSTGSSCPAPRSPTGTRPPIARRQGRWRRRLINEALRPPVATADWLRQIDTLRAEGAETGVDPIAVGLRGLSVVTARDEDEAATVIALLLRETLETPDATAALITPDADLARRVSARLTRWNIGADSSSGRPLAGAPVAVLASLVARAVADPTDPVSLLAIAKHPLSRLGLTAGPLAAARWALELRGLRGPRPGDWPQLAARLADQPAALDLAGRLRVALDRAAAPFADDVAAPADAARALALALESLAAGPNGGVGELWAGMAGEAAAGLLSALIHESEGLPPATRAGFSELLDGLLAGETLRGGAASHPRLAILGVLEARLVRADRLILAGLEEGVWPRAAPLDPFLSRPMRQRLGLPPPERRIGLSAHDFAQAAAAPRVVLLHCERRAGSPVVASRWLWRLQTLARGAGVELPRRAELLAWARALDAPLDPPPPGLKTAARPAPAPPLAVRPRRMAVTGVERWVRDPYAPLRPLHPPAAPLDPPDCGDRGPGPRNRHPCRLRAFLPRPSRGLCRTMPTSVSPPWSSRLWSRPACRGGRMAREQALAANVAPWVIDFERRRRPGARLHVETRGEYVFETPGGPFTLTASADRIEARGRERRRPRLQDRPAAQRQGGPRRPRAATHPDRRHPRRRRVSAISAHAARRTGLCPGDPAAASPAPSSSAPRPAKAPPWPRPPWPACAAASPFSTTPPPVTCPGPCPSSSAASTATTTTSPACGNGG